MMANTAERFWKKSKIFLFVVFAFFVFVGGLVWFVKASGPVSNDKTQRRFVIENGSGASLIGADLARQGLAKSSLAFKIYVSLTGVSSKIQAGEYSLNPNMNLFQLVNLLVKGPEEIWVTIPEGLRREEIAQRFASAFGNPGFADQFLSVSKNDEGYLFPDTYLLPRDITGSAVVPKMKETFNQKITFKVSYNDVILASILERETITAEERPIVAGILLKRLNAGWPLQADATVQYIVATSQCPVPTASCDWWPKSLTGSDLAINSAYNTYVKTGLPPAPISNPGLSSLKAAVNPKDSPYWYYLHDSDGKIHYAATIEEQNANVQKYLR